MQNSQSTSNGIFEQRWQLESTGSGPKATVIIVHGLGEYSDRYAAMAGALTDAGYAVAAIDLPGHGRSEGVRGHIDEFTDYHAPLLALTLEIRRQQPNVPLYILGHSMGGLIVSQLVLDHQELYDGILLSGAAIKSPQQPPNWQIWLIGAISRIAPKLGMLKLDASGISRDQSVVDKYMQDPLVYKGKLSARFIHAMFAAMTETISRAAIITQPVLIMHGGDDVVTDPAGSQLLHDTVTSTDKTLKIYPGLYHEIFNEPEAQDVFADVVNWLDQRS